MYIIFAAILFAIIFYFWSAIKNIFTATIMSSSGVTSQGFIWFGSLVLLNVVIFGFIIWFYYYIKDMPGPVGKPGYPGLQGDDAKDCKTC
jgi:hypothetical protein